MSFEFLFGERTGKELQYVYDTIARAEQTGGIAPELIDELRRELQRANDLYSTKPHDVAGEACRTVLFLARSMMFTCDNRPSVKHKRTLHARARDPRNPGLQQWIEKQVQRLPDATAKEIYCGAPAWVTDDVGEDRFIKRVTQARKALVASK